MPLTEAQLWERRYIEKAREYAKLLLAVAERELELFEERVARECMDGALGHVITKAREALG